MMNVLSKPFRAKCVACEFVSPSVNSVVIACWIGLKHSKRVHPDLEGFVTYVFKE
jgi:hypothetical protein